MDDFPLIGTNAMPLVVNMPVPSVSPIFGNNAAFQVYRFDGSTGAILGESGYRAKTDQPTGIAMAARV